MQSDLFAITCINAPWQGLHYAVTWPGRGSVSVRQHRYIMLEQAFLTGDFSIGVTNGSECVRINADVIWQQNYGPEFLDHVFSPMSELTAVAFSERCYAEDFVDRMEKIIAWKMLTRRHSPG